MSLSGFWNPCRAANSLYGRWKAYKHNIAYLNHIEIVLISGHRSTHLTMPNERNLFKIKSKQWDKPIHLKLQIGHNKLGKKPLGNGPTITVSQKTPHRIDPFSLFCLVWSHYPTSGSHKAKPCNRSFQLQNLAKLTKKKPNKINGKKR